MDKADISKDIVFQEVDLEANKGLIIATLGKACKHPETLIQMIDSGMNVVRMRLCQEERK